jgi:hypothetical protein
VLEAAAVAPESQVVPEAEVEIATENVQNSAVAEVVEVEVTIENEQTPVVTEVVEDAVVEPTVD